MCTLVAGGSPGGGSSGGSGVGGLSSEDRLLGPGSHPEGQWPGGEGRGRSHRSGGQGRAGEKRRQAPHRRQRTADNVQAVLWLFKLW